jgi:hypothetical protein
LKQSKVGLFLHQQGIDTSTAAGNAFFQMLGVFAEFERAIIVERVNAGIARAKANGTKSGTAIGRPGLKTKKLDSARGARRGSEHPRSGAGGGHQCGIGGGAEEGDGGPISRIIMISLVGRLVPIRGPVAHPVAAPRSATDGQTETSTFDTSDIQARSPNGRS